MKYRKLLKASTESILKNRMRSLLTMLGIIIGVGAVIVMVAVGQGAQQEVEERISALGTNVIMVMPEASRYGGVARGAGSASTLTLADVEHIRNRTTRVAHVSPVVRISGQAVAGRNNWATTVWGVSPDYLPIRDFRIAGGAVFAEADMARRANVAVLGATVAQELFRGDDPIGQQIRIGSTPLRVIGVLQAKGQSGFGQDQDDMILVPATTAQYRMGGGRNVSQIFASASTRQDMDAAQAEIAEVIRLSHRLAPTAPDGFQVRNQAEITETASATTRTFTLLLGSIAGVSLLVGGIGIMNIMLVSVTERTREIGIRLAVGARGSDVLSQFLLEAIVLSVLGGVLGVLAAFGLTAAVSQMAGLTTVIQPGIVMLSLAFAAGVGVFFGFYPARKAAALDPIDALRYE